MYSSKLNKSVKWIFSWLLTLSCIIFSLPTISFAADSSGTVTISNVSYTTSTLSKGDTFSISFQFYATLSDASSDEEITVKSVSVSGDAVDDSDMVSSLSDDDGTITNGEIVKTYLSKLTYTGVGTEVTVTVSTSCGSKTYTFNLKTMTTENAQGALVLDSTATGNLSFSLNAGQSKQFTVPIKNAADSAIKNGVAKVYFESTTVGLSVTSGEYTTISSLASGATKNITFTVNATTAVKAGTYSLILELNSMKQQISIAIDNEIAPPSLELSINANSTFSLGEINPITLYVKNVGGKAAKNIKVTIENDADLAVVGNSNVKTISTLAAGASTNYSAKLQLDSSTSSNLVLLKLGLTYTDEAGESYSDTQTIYLNTDTVKNTNDLSITNITSPSGTYVPDQNFAVSFNITSKYGAENVKVSVIPDDGVIAKSQSVFVLSELAAGKSQKYTVSLAATDAATTGNHPIQILLEYEYQDKDFSMSQYSSVNVSNDDDDDDLTSPKVILSECVASPQVVQAGQDVTINFTFKNTHPSKTVYNLTATLDFNTQETDDDDETTTSATSLFSTVSSSNTLFTTSLAPGESNSQSIVIGTSVSATAASYDVYVDLSYQDEDGNEITSTETIPITISQDITIDIAQIDLSSLTVGRSTAMTATIYNTSKSDISNVMMYLESDALDTGFSVTDNKAYLSAFAMGDTEYYAPTLTGLAAGTYDVTLVIEYEDCLGDPQTLRYPFQVEVADTHTGEEMQGMGGPGEKGNMQDTQKSSLNPWLIGGIIVAIAALLLVIKKILKKRKAAKEFDIHE